jgi:VanZ family protein
MLTPNRYSTVNGRLLKVIFPSAGQRAILRLIWVGCASAIILGSLLPGDSFPVRTLERLPINDKAQHALAYAVLTLIPVLHEKWRHAAVFLVIAAVMGTLLEFGQLYSPGRSYDTRDMLADAIGIIVGVTCGLLLRPRDRSSDRLE